jgi:hypothetical protein
MIDLLMLLAAVGITLAFYVWRRPTSRIERLAFIVLYCLSLGLALRFGGRTYPGIYFPRSPFLNSLLNGNALFTQVGYDAVFVAGVADGLRLGTASRDQRFQVALQVLKWLAVTAALVIAVFGFWCAFELQRLP